MIEKALPNWESLLWIFLTDFITQKRIMSNVLNEVVAANQNYAAGFGEKRTQCLPTKICHFTRMDARLDPAKYAGLSEA